MGCGVPFEANSRRSTHGTGREYNEKGPSQHPKDTADSLVYTLLNLPADPPGEQEDRYGRHSVKDSLEQEIGDDQTFD